MKTMTLVSRQRYYGLDALSLRDAANRVLARLPEAPSERAMIRLEALSEDLQMSVSSCRAVVARMVQGGLLLPLAATESAGYRVTERLREVARARIIQPLPRQQAQALLAACVETARRFNRSANRNKYEIEAIAVYGSYMSQDVELPDLAIGITGRRRAPGERRVVGRATDQTEGTAEIRALFEAQSNYVEVAFFKRLPDVPRPFSVIFKADD